MENANGFFMVWNPARNLPTFRHPNRVAAKREAERLAAQQPGDEFYVLKAVSRSAMPKVAPITTKTKFDPAVAGPKADDAGKNGVAGKLTFYTWSWK